MVKKYINCPFSQGGTYPVYYVSSFLPGVYTPRLLCVVLSGLGFRWRPEAKPRSGDTQ
jgi:hypothetical protein